MLCRVALVLFMWAAVAASVSIQTKETKTTFLLTEEKVSSDQADRMCKSHGNMVPIAIESREKHLEVIKFLASYEISSVWTSGNDLEDRSIYRWTSTDKVFTYTKWLKDVPTGDDSCRCVSVVSGVHADCGEQISCAGWTVEPCSDKRHVLCEVRQDCPK